MNPFTRNFFLLWHGQCVSVLGNQAFLIATVYLTFEQTDSMASVGAVMMASTLPLALLAPLGGAMADRYSRRTILIVTDTARALAIGGFALTLLWRPSAASALGGLVVISAFNGTMAALFAPALHSFIPDIVPKDRLALANSVNQLSNQSAALAGQAAGGLLYVSLGAPGLLLLDALSFAYGAFATALIPRELQPLRGGISAWTAIREHIRSTRAGMSYVRGCAGMLPLLAVFGGVNFLFMPVIVVLPLYVQNVLGKGSEWYGFLLAASAAGALFGAAVAGVVLSRVRNFATIVPACVMAIAVCVLALAATTASGVALGIFIAIGTVSSLINVTVITSLQSVVQSEFRGRVMALAVTLSTLAAPVGMGVGGIVADRWRDSIALLFVGCGAAIAALILLVFRRPGFRALLRPDLRSLAVHHLL